MPIRFMVSGATTSIEQLLQDGSVAPYLGAMVTPQTANSVSRVVSWRVPWCVDNSAYRADRFSEARFLALCERCALAEAKPQWVAVPDVVGDHAATRHLFWKWLPRLEKFHLPLAFVAQDGLDYYMDDVPWEHISCVFVGGTNVFKEDSTIDIAQRCRQQGRLCHLGRVNGRRRLRLAIHNGCDSVDGSSLSRFALTWLPKFAEDARQLETEGRLIDILNELMELEIAALDAVAAGADPGLIASILREDMQLAGPTAPIVLPPSDLPGRQPLMEHWPSC